jgi:hypothetical protein
MPGQNLVNFAYLFAVALVLGKYAAALEDAPFALNIDRGQVNDASSLRSSTSP